MADKERTRGGHMVDTHEENTGRVNCARKKHRPLIAKKCVPHQHTICLRLLLTVKIDGMVCLMMLEYVSSSAFRPQNMPAHSTR